jgi:hypothetical protein
VQKNEEIPYYLLFIGSIFIIALVSSRTFVFVCGRFNSCGSKEVYIKPLYPVKEIDVDKMCRLLYESVVLMKMLPCKRKREIEILLK